jgi:hypothetical protein
MNTDLTTELPAFIAVSELSFEEMGALFTTFSIPHMYQEEIDKLSTNDIYSSLLNSLIDKNIVKVLPSEDGKHKIEVNIDYIKM